MFRLTRRAKKRLAFLLAGAIVLGGALAGAYVLRERQRDRLAAESRVKGMEAFKAGDYKTTLTKLGYYLGRSAKNRKDAEALLTVAKAQLKLPTENGGHIREAINYAQAASEITPEDPAPLELLLSQFMKIGMVPEVQSTAKRLLEIEPKNYEAMSSLVQADLIGGDAQAALTNADALLAAHPEDVLANQLVVECMKRSNVDPAKIADHLWQVTQEYPDRIEFAIMHLSYLIEAQRLPEPDRVMELAQRAASMRAPGPAALNVMVSLLDGLRLSMPNLTGAQRSELTRLRAGAIDSAMSDPASKAWAPALAAQLAWRAGDSQAASRYVNDGDQPARSEASADLLGWRCYLAKTSDDGGDTSADESALASIGSDTAQGWELTLEGLDREHGGDWPGARTVLTEAVKKDGSNLVAGYLLALAERSVGEWRAAADRLRDLLKRAPDSLPHRIALFWTLHGHGRTDEAFTEAKRVRLFYPSNADGLYIWAIAAVETAESGGLDQAHVDGLIEDLTRLSDQASERGEALGLLARACLAAGRTERAERAVNRIVGEKLTMPASSLARLVAACDRHGIAGADALLAQPLSDAERGNPDLVYRRAMHAAAAGHPQQAEQLFKDAIASASGGQKLALRLAFGAYLDRTGDQRALRVFEQAAAENPESADAQIRLLDSTAAWSDESVVRDAIDRLRKLTGQDAIAWRVYEARRYLAFDRSPADAAKYVQMISETLKREPRNATALTVMANLMLIGEPSDLSPAIEYLRRAQAVHPDDAGLSADLVRLLMRGGSSADADVALRRYAQINGLSAAELRTRATIMIGAGMRDQAVRDLTSLGDQATEEDRVRLAMLQVQRGDRDAASKIFESLLASHPKNLTTYVAAAEFVAAGGDVERGRSIVEGMPDGIDPLDRAVALADFLMRHGDAARAESILSERAESSGGPDAWIELSRLHASLDDGDGAADSISRGLAANPGDASLKALRYALNLIKQRKGSVPDLAMWASALRDDRLKDGCVRLVGILEKTNGGTTEEAVTELTSFVRSHGSFYLGWSELIQARRSAGDIDGAIRSAQRAALAMPLDDRPCRIAAGLLATQKNFEGAIAAARQWRQRVGGDTFQPDLFLADVSDRLDRTGPALQWLLPHRDRLLQEVQRKADGAPVRLEFLARLLAKAGRFSEADSLLWPLAQQSHDWALAYLKAAGLADPSQRAQWIDKVAPVLSEDQDPVRVAQARLELGMSLQTSGRPDQAETQYRKILDAIGPEAVVLNNLAVIVRDKGRIEDATGYASQAVELAEKNGFKPPALANLLDTLGSCQIAASEFSQALQTYERAKGLDPTSAAVIAGLAIATYEKGDADAAVGIISAVKDADLQNKARQAVVAHFKSAGRDADAARFEVKNKD